MALNSFPFAGESEAGTASDCCDSSATRSYCALIQGLILQLLRRNQHRPCRPDPVADNAMVSYACRDGIVFSSMYSRDCRPFRPS